MLVIRLWRISSRSYSLCLHDFPLPNAFRFFTFPFLKKVAVPFRYSTRPKKPRLIDDVRSRPTSILTLAAKSNQVYISINNLPNVFLRLAPRTVPSLLPNVSLPTSYDDQCSPRPMDPPLFPEAPFTRMLQIAHPALVARPRRSLLRAHHSRCRRWRRDGALDAEIERPSGEEHE